MFNSIGSQLRGLLHKYEQLTLPKKIIVILLVGPLVASLFLLKKNFNSWIKYGLIIALVLFVQIPWMSGLANLFSQSDTKISNIESDKQTTSAQNSPSPVVSPTPDPTIVPEIELEYKNLTTDCSDSYLKGTLEVLNLGNISISGRVELPVFTDEKFMVPLSGIFLDIAPLTSKFIDLESKAGCKKSQKVGEPETVFTIPSLDNLERINVSDAFKWSGISTVCDGPFGRVKLTATVKNLSDSQLTAGIKAYLSNGPLSEGSKKAGLKGDSLLATIYKINPGESRRIDFGYGSSCIKGAKGFDGPYFVEFETMFTY